MSKTLTAASLPRLSLTQKDEFALRQLGAQLQREIVSQYEKFVFQERQRVDEKRWKQVGSDGDLQAFVERRSAVKEERLKAEALKHGYAYASDDSGLPKPQHDIHPQAKLARETGLRRVIVTGVQPGTLDDMMYGSAFHDTPSFQAFWASQNATMEESAVLATIEGPSLHDPYRFMGVTWTLRSFGLPTAVLNKRDMLAFTDLHISKLSNGERIGVSVAHSIQHRDLAELREFGTVRATLSLLRVFRQIDDHRVEVFSMQLLDTKGCAPEALNIAESVKFLMPSSGRCVSEAFRKKLRWMMRGRERPRFDSTMSDSIEPMSSGSNDQCEICSRKTGKIFSCAGTSCQLCYKRVCSRCSVAQDGMVSGRLGSKRSSSSSKTVDFCIQCVLHAKSQRTLTVAREDLLDYQRTSSSSTHSNSSGGRSHSSNSNSSSHNSHNSFETRKRSLTMLLVEPIDN